MERSPSFCRIFQSVWGDMATLEDKINNFLESEPPITLDEILQDSATVTGEDGFQYLIITITVFYHYEA